MFSAAGSVARLIPAYFMFLLLGVILFFSGYGFMAFVDQVSNEGRRIESYGNAFVTGHIVTRTNILRDTVLTPEQKLGLHERISAKRKQDSLEYVNIFKD